MLHEKQAIRPREQAKYPSILCTIQFFIHPIRLSVNAYEAIP